MAERLRCGVIGAGGIGIEHLLSLQSCPRATAVAIAENQPQRAREISERFKIPRSYADYRELLEQPDIDAVTIALPNHLHAPVALEALKARKDVLLEKPMALNALEATKVAEAARRMRKTVMVGHNFRFRRDTQMARMLIERGDLGVVYHARAFWLRRVGIPRIGSWFTQKKLAGGGCVTDLGVHFLDLCLHLLKEFEATTVLAATHAEFGPHGQGEIDYGKSEIDPRKPFDVEDHGAAFIRLKSGQSVILEASWAGYHDPEAREYGVDLLGTKGGLSLFPARWFRHGPSGHETIALAGLKPPCSEDRIHHFVACVLDGRKPLVSLEESLKVQRILDAIYQSAATGREVRLK